MMSYKKLAGTALSPSIAHLIYVMILADKIDILKTKSKN
jgi:hypothetical protein